MAKKKHERKWWEGEQNKKKKAKKKKTSKKKRLALRAKLKEKLGKPSRNSTFKHKSMDSSECVVMLKKRAEDTDIINYLLSSKSTVKLTLQQLRLLERLRIVDNVTPKERKLITGLFKNK